MDKRVSILILGGLLVFLGSCGKDGSNISYEAPQHVTTKTPFETDVHSEEEESEINPYELGKNDPCYNYLRHEVVKPVATCTKLDNGQIKESYKSVVTAGKLCLLRKSFPNGVSLYTLIGELEEREKDVPAKRSRIDVFGQSSRDQELLLFEMKADDHSFIKYNLTENSVTVRQVSKLWKKKRRYFRFSCRPISRLVD